MTRGLGLVLYGSEGIGKTGTALQFAHVAPAKCLSIGETGFEDLEVVGEVPKNCTNVTIRSWEQLLKESDVEPNTVLILDSLSGLQEILYEYVCRTIYKSNWEAFTSYWKGQRVDSPVILSSYLDSLNELRSQGVHVILTGHMITVDAPNTLGANYLSHVLDMDQGDKGAGCRAEVMKWAQAILFMNIDVSITRPTEVNRESKMVMEGKAKDDDNRLIYTTKSPGHSAKNRLGLPPIISMGTSAKEAFTNLWSAMPPVYKDLV